VKQAGGIHWGEGNGVTELLERTCSIHGGSSRARWATRMEERSFNPFRDRRADEGANVRLAIARNLARIYAEVLDDPLPEDLRILIEKWEGGESARQG
jgi:hypothetical protein